MRSNVRDQKAEIMGAVMQLNAEDAAKFWPIYSEYDTELSKVNDLRVQNIEEYAQNYTQMTDDKADELIQKAMDYQTAAGRTSRKILSAHETGAGRNDCCAIRASGTPAAPDH